jgi:hypothetical protein
MAGFIRLNPQCVFDVIERFVENAYLFVTFCHRVMIRRIKLIPLKRRFTA